MTRRERMEREASPSAAVLDSQSVKSAERGQYPTNEAGYEAGKQPKGRKIHALVDTDGLPVRVVVLLRRDPGRDSVGWSSTNTQPRSAGRTDLGRWRLRRVVS